ncbi:hypothetical protein EDD11_004920 [Mortierella claussenii]|nr:hypothetical protein EDD11_004920 [Mortierella claussenii]
MAPVATAPAPIDPSALYSGSLLSLIVLILDLIAIVQVLNSDRTVLSKLLWCLLIFLFPIIGIIIYYLFAERERHRLRYVSIP